MCSVSAKTVTNNLPILSVLQVVVVKESLIKCPINEHEHYFCLVMCTDLLSVFNELVPLRYVLNNLAYGHEEVFVISPE